MREHEEEMRASRRSLNAVREEHATMMASLQMRMDQKQTVIEAHAQRIAMLEARLEVKEAARLKAECEAIKANQSAEQAAARLASLEALDAEVKAKEQAFTEM